MIITVTSYKGGVGKTTTDPAWLSPKSMLYRSDRQLGRNLGADRALPHHLDRNILLFASFIVAAGMLCSSPGHHDAD